MVRNMHTSSFIGSVRAPAVSHRSKEQILVLLMGYRPFTALSSSSPHALETVLGDKPPCDGTDGCAIAPVQPEWTAGSASCYKQREQTLKPVMKNKERVVVCGPSPAKPFLSCLSSAAVSLSFAPKQREKEIHNPWCWFRRPPLTL